MVTIKINERTKDGKALLEFLKNYSEKSKGVEIVKAEKKSSARTKFPAVSQDRLKPQVLKTFKNTDEGKGLKKFESVKDLLEELNS